jgi:hypothetical protein
MKAVVYDVADRLPKLQQRHVVIFPLLEFQLGDEIIN